MLLATVCLLPGCGLSAHRTNSPPVVNTDPVGPDEAMQKRDWTQVDSVYPNGAVAAGPTDFKYEPRRGQAEWKYYFADSGTFFLNMILLPFNVIGHPPTETVIAPGETVGPTFTAEPMLPPALVVQPSTPPVTESPGTEPSTPPVVEPGAMPPPTAPASETAPAPTPAPSDGMPAPAPAPVDITPVPAPAPAAAPAEATPAPAPPAVPAPVQTEMAPAAAPAPAEPAPAPATAAPAATPSPMDITPRPAPAPVVEPAPQPGEVAPSTPRVIEPPPADATKNLAPQIHLNPTTWPSASPNMNK